MANPETSEGNWERRWRVGRNVSALSAIATGAAAELALLGPEYVAFWAAATAVNVVQTIGAEALRLYTKNRGGKLQPAPA